MLLGRRKPDGCGAIGGQRSEEILQQMQRTCWSQFGLFCHHAGFGENLVCADVW